VQDTAFGEPLLEIAEEPPRGGIGKIGLVVAAALGVVAIGGGAMWLFKHRSPSTTPAAALPAAPVAPLPAATPDAAIQDNDESMLVPQKLVETTLLQGRLDDLLEQARGAMHERHYTEPAGKNALLYYRSAHAVDPSNGEANDGLQRVAAVLVSRFEEGLKNGRLEEAASALANLQQAIPGDARLADLQRRLTDREMTRLLADGNFETANRLLQKESGVLPPEQLAKYRAEIAHRQQDVAVSRLASQVDSAIKEGRLEGGDDSARGLLAQLQAAAPGSPVAAHAMHDLGAAYLRRARDAKSSADQDHWLQLARASGISQGEIDASRRDIAAARQKAAQAENEHTLALVRERLRDGRLTEPAQDSAVFYAGQLQTTDPNGAATGTAKTELAAKLLERARGSINLGKMPLADADIQLAKRYGGDPKEISALTALESSRAEAAHATPPAAAAGGASSSTDSAAGAGANAPKRLRYVPPEFPAKALAQNLAGSVTVAFTVDANGDPRDLRVMEATPPGIFDHAALVAVKRWHYQPTVVDGKPTEVPVQVVVRFPKPQ
jgi:TonB family protein